MACSPKTLLQRIFVFSKFVSHREQIILLGIALVRRDQLGQHSRECVDLVMKCQMVLLGNHDQGAMFDPDGFNPPAEKAIFWTRAQLESPAGNSKQRELRWEFLAERPGFERPDDATHFPSGVPRASWFLVGPTASGKIADNDWPLGICVCIELWVFLMVQNRDGVAGENR